MHSTLFRALAIAASLAGSSTIANAAMVVSSAPTLNVTCAKAICTATAANAVLSIGRLQSMLAKENPKLVSGSVANDIVISTALTWVSSHTLTLDAYRSIIVNKPVTITGTGGLTLLTNDGGADGMFSFGKKASITFWSLSSSLTINGTAYTLVNNIAALASDVTANSLGDYALAANYDASVDGTYSRSPVPGLDGKFEGLGNTISNFTMDVSTKNNQTAGLFFAINTHGSAENVSLINVSIKGGKRLSVGGLAGENIGALLSEIFVSGKIVGGSDSATGAVVGDNDGIIVNSHATAKVRAITSPCTLQTGCSLGGLAGVNGGQGEIRDSYATGTVSGGGFAGGLVGDNLGAISNSYATGAVSGGNNAVLGGLVGKNGSSFSTGTVNASYSTGTVVGGDSSTIGGLVGADYSGSGSITNSYWDTTTSGIANSSQGTGNISNDPGITGLTTVQLRGGLPTGFDPSIWAESSTINRGLPYLLDIPPT